MALLSGLLVVPLASGQDAVAVGQSVSAASAELSPVAEKPCEGEGTREIDVQVRDLRSSDGLVTVELFNNDPDGFIKKSGRLERIRTVAAGNKAFVCFKAPGPGVYAIALYHDENGNKKFDKNFLGIPTEGFGFSNNPSFFFGPPDHADAAFEVGDETVTLEISVRYL